LRQVETRGSVARDRVLAFGDGGGAGYLAQQAPTVQRHTLDISGDGISEPGLRLRDVKQQVWLESRDRECAGY